MITRMRPVTTRTLALVLAAPVVLGLGSVTARADGAALPGPAGEPGPSASATAPDARLRAGCRDYTLRYEVQDADEDWLLTLDVSDRRGRGVAHVTLHGVEDPRRGRTSFTVCRSAVKAGRFTVGGVLADRDGYEQTEHAVHGDRFWLARR